MNYFPAVIHLTNIGINILADSIDEIPTGEPFTVLKTDATENDLDLTPSPHKECKCGSTNLATFNAKHDDRFNLTHRPLAIDLNNYAPSIGPFQSDYTSMTICLSCGQIQNWKPIKLLDLIDSLPT